MTGRSPKQSAGAGWLRRLAGYLLRHKADLAIAFAGAIVGSAAQVVVPLVERQIVDKVVLSHASPLAPWLGTLLGLGVVTFAGAYFRRYRGGRVALQVQFDLRSEMQAHLQRLDFQTLDTMPTGQLVARANSDTMLVQGLLSFLPIMSGNVLMLLLSLAVMLYLSPLLGVVAVLVAPTLLLVSYRMRWRVFPATWDGQQKEGEVAQIVDEDVSGVRVVKAFGQERRELERLAAAASHLYGSQMRAVRIQARYQPLLRAIPAFGQVGVLAFGGYLTLHHEMTLGTFLVFSTYLTQLVAPARMLSGMLTVAQQARAGIERIFQLLDTEPRIADMPGAAELPPLRGEVVFDGVELAYGDGPSVLRGVDLSVSPGETLAIVGSSGSGKSTLVMPVPRFYEVGGGCVRLDGRDVRGLSLRCLRSQVGVVFEESFLFSDTVRANIAYGRPGASFEEVEAAARAAQAHDFISELPEGYESLVGERGLTLSGGQRQRIALARAILARPRILVLDDATSAVDAEVEARIHRALRQEMAGRTMLVVAHRRSTLQFADRVAVLEGGRVVEVGTHEELVERSPLYRSLISGSEGPGQGKSDDRAGLVGLAPLAARVLGSGSPPRPGAHQGGPAGLGAGLMGGGHGWRRNLTPTPELLERVAALSPVKDFPEVDLEEEARPDPRFSLRSLLREHRCALGLGLALVVLDALFSLAGPMLVKQGVDAGIARGSEATLLLASAVYLAVTLVDLLDEVGSAFVLGRTAQRIMLSLRVRIWAQLQRLSLDYYEREMAGRTMTRMTTDVDQFESLIENGLLSALVGVVTFVGVGAALLALDLELGLVTLSVVVPLGLATAWFRKRAARLYDIARERIAVVNADFQESLSGVRESQAFVHEGLTESRFREKAQDYLDARVRAQRLVATYFPFVALLADVADALVLGVGAGRVLSGHLTAGALIAFVLYIDMFFSPIQQLSQVFDSWQQTRVSVRRIAEVMALPVLTPDHQGAAAPGRLAGEVALEEVHFSYPAAPPPPEAAQGGGGAARRRPEELLEGTYAASGGGGGAARRRPPEALRGVELEVRPGETLALVGQTGAGKSTVMKLIARFYDPDEGAVLADGADLRSLELGPYRAQLGYVPQEPFLFTGTVRYNIAYGRPGATLEEVRRAAAAVGADELVTALPGGYDHVLSERGRSLSAGQRQLIALARAELVDPAILLLDEATSNLDLATETRVNAAMRAVSDRRTTILIAHRLQTARAADRIAVLEAGRLVEVGTDEELLALGGRYASMWEAFELVGAAGPRASAPPGLL